MICAENGAIEVNVPCETGKTCKPGDEGAICFSCPAPRRAVSKTVNSSVVERVGTIVVRTLTAAW